jgi:histidinol-phosphate aminotransferase
VSEGSRAGALEALRTCSELLDLHVRMVCEERPRVIAGLRERGFDVADSQANFVWAAHPELSGGELAARMALSGVLVAEGDALGEPQHVRIAVHRPASTTRLLAAIDTALG